MNGYVFKRYELKYLLNPKQFETVKQEICRRLSPDAFGETTIQSLYFDTDDFRLIRESVEKPIFKEKLRLRCYGLNDTDKDVFFEMKRKFDGVVYKRRISCKESDVPSFLSGKIPQTQIGNELSYFLRFYPNLSPKMMILYDREAFFDSQSELRVTFDRNIRYRKEALNLHSSLEGNALLPEDVFLMEVKISDAYPLWLCRLLSQNHVYKQSFSKYGFAYEQECRNHQQLGSFTLCLNPFFATELSRP